MGIRIHKAIGYGLTDVVADQDSWSLKNDSRFNPNGYPFGDGEKFDLAGFRDYIEERIESMDGEDIDHSKLILLKRRIESGECKEPYYSVIYDMEFGEDNVMLFIPPSSTKSWTRYDDIIDYYDPVNQATDGGCGSSVIKINRPLWPWDSYINIKNMPPVRLIGTQLQKYITIQNLGFENIKQPDKMLNDIGVKSKEELDTYIVPIIPLELVELIKYLKIFTDDKYIYQLRPLIYGYWC